MFAVALFPALLNALLFTTTTFAQGRLDRDRERIVGRRWANFPFFSSPSPLTSLCLRWRSGKTSPQFQWTTWCLLLSWTSGKLQQKRSARSIDSNSSHKLCSVWTENRNLQWHNDTCDHHAQRSCWEKSNHLPLEGQSGLWSSCWSNHRRYRRHSLWSSPLFLKSRRSRISTE